MSSESETTTTYAECVASCCLAAGLALPRLPVRRRLDLLSGADLDDAAADDDGGDLLCRAAEATERSYYEAKCRASQGPEAPPPPPQAPAFVEKQCICLRGACDVEWKERGGRWGWAYVCSAPPKCYYFAWCEESIVNQNSQPTFRSHPEPSNPCAFTPNNHRISATAPVNVNLEGAGTAVPINVSLQGAGTTNLLYVSPHGTRSNSGWPFCKCAAGRCKKLRIKGVEYYICPVQKGQGACPYRVPVITVAEEVQPEGDEWQFDIVGDDIVPKGHLTPAHLTSFAVAAQESPTMPHRPIAMVELERSPMPPSATSSPVTPRLKSNSCFKCGKEGHWSKNCSQSPCYRCGMVGHWAKDCTKSPSQSNVYCFQCGQAGHWKTNCPVLLGKRGL